MPVVASFYGASPVAFDDKTLLSCDNGNLFIIVPATGAMTRIKLAP